MFTKRSHSNTRCTNHVENQLRDSHIANLLACWLLPSNKLYTFIILFSVLTRLKVVYRSLPRNTLAIHITLFTLLHYLLLYLYTLLHCTILCFMLFLPASILVLANVVYSTSLFLVPSNKPCHLYITHIRTTGFFIFYVYLYEDTA
jgi:hypothetical protein